MSYNIAEFSQQVALNAAIHKWNPNRLTELQAIAAALGTDPTTHDATIATAPAGLRPGNRANTRFTNDVLLVVNAGKAGNLTPAAMGAAITAGLGNYIPPVNNTPPQITYVSGGTGAGTQPGAQYARSNGTWTPAGVSFSTQWMRSGVPIPGSTGASYTTVAADAGTNLTCVVTAMNAAGETSATSNSAAIT